MRVVDVYKRFCCAGESLPIYCLVEIARRTVRILRACFPKEEKKIKTEEGRRKRGKSRKKGQDEKIHKRRKIDKWDEVISLDESEDDEQNEGKSKSVKDFEDEDDYRDDGEIDGTLFEMLPVDVRDIVCNFVKIRCVNETNIPKRIIFGRQIGMTNNKGEMRKTRNKFDA